MERPRSTERMHVQHLAQSIGLPRWFSGKESTCRCRRHRRCKFDSWIGKIPCRREWQPTPVFLPGKSHGQRSLAGYSPWGRKESDMTEHAHPHTHTHTHTLPIFSLLPGTPSPFLGGKSCFLIISFGKLSLIQTATHVRFSLSHPSIF